jgi:hypothetical protein
VAARLAAATSALQAAEAPQQLLAELQQCAATLQALADCRCSLAGQH